jgi:poly(3-hydroxybutyrate) depolymerase
MVHGTTDTNYPIVGGAGAFGTPDGGFFPVDAPTGEDTLSIWQGLNATSTTGTTVLTAGIATCTLFSGAADVEFCRLTPTESRVDGDVICDGGGHAWPGGVKGLKDIADVPTADLDGSRVIWDFFAAHRRP